jgi:hypothetical protein
MIEVLEADYQLNIFFLQPVDLTCLADDGVAVQRRAQPVLTPTQKSQ